MSLIGRFRVARDRSVTVANLVDELLRRNGDRAISMEDSGPRYLADLHAEVCALDAFLRRDVGLRPGQPVAVYRSNDPSCFRWFLAIIRAGGIAVPLNPMLTLAEVERILTRSSTEILVTDQRTFSSRIHTREALSVRTWIQSDQEAETVQGFLRAPGDMRAADAESSTPAFAPTVIAASATIAIFHTSGTSGFPKGAALSSRALLGPRGFTVLTGLLLGQKDLALVALPWSHIMAVSIALYGLMAGTRGCFLDHFSVAGALELIERNRITAVVGVPTMFHRLVESNPDAARLATVRVWVSASDHLPSDVRNRLRKHGAFLRLPGLRVPSLVINGYGMVELGGMAMMGIELSLAPGSGDLCFPVPPFHIRVADENNRPVRIGVTGECQIRRPGLTPHYWHAPGEGSGEGAKEISDSAGGDSAGADSTGADSASADALLTSDGWLRTGDLATRNRLGLIRLVGRMKDVIKSGGYSVYVRELEEAIVAHPAVARAAAFGLPHSEKGEIPAAAVELHPGSEATATDLLDWCRDRLAPYKAPRRIWILDPGGLPQNHTGKVLRRELRERFSTAAE